MADIVKTYRVEFTLQPGKMYGIDAATPYEAEAGVRIYLERFGVTYHMLGAAIIEDAMVCHCD